MQLIAEGLFWNKVNPELEKSQSYIWDKCNTFIASSETLYIPGCEGEHSGRVSAQEPLSEWWTVSLHRSGTTSAL